MDLRINDRIRTRKVEFFNNFALTLRHDSVASSFTFDGYFNPANKELKEMYCVGHYHEVIVAHEGQQLLNGYLVTQTFNNGDRRELVRLDGYSKPGVLQECEIPLSAYPLQSDGLTLKEIAQRLIAPFGLKMIIHDSVSELMDESYAKTSADASQTVESYLSELAQQKGVVISHDIYGNLLFTRASTNKKPVMAFDINQKGERSIPFSSMGLTFNGQGMHSEITVIKQPSASGGNAGESTIKNPYVPYVYRPHVVVQSSGTDNDTDKTAKMLLAAELKNLKLVIKTDRWRIDKKTIITPNNIITVRNPEVYLWEPTKFFVEEVAYEGNAEEMVATLTCCLPEVYSLEYPKYIYQGINTH